MQQWSELHRIISPCHVVLQTNQDHTKFPILDIQPDNDIFVKTHPNHSPNTAPPLISAADRRGCHKRVRFDGDDASSSSSKRTAPSDPLSCCILAKSIALPSRHHRWVRVLANCCVGWCHLHCRSSPPLLLHHKTFFVKPHRQISITH